MFTGALASSYYGTPRTTMDVDIVARISGKNLRTKLAPALRMAGLQVDLRRFDVASRSGIRIVTLRDSTTPFTVDIMLSGTKLEKNAGTILGLPTFYQKPEDLILAKLRMIKATIPKERALKDEDDVRAILKFTKVRMNIVKRRARGNNTLSILQTITARGP